MSGGDDRFDGRVVAQEAEPLRAPLTRYFRRRVKDPAEVEDLVQEVFARIVARRDIGPIANLGGYVFQTASSVLADQARRRAARRAEAHVVFDPDRHANTDFDAGRIVVGRDDLRRATDALRALPERTRTIFLLHRLDGRRYRDIATELGISVSAVEKHMVRAIQHLSQAMGTPE
jgi:RNA polymerase sigma-70 factor (ECF subfamily)